MEVIRAYKAVLDPTVEQRTALARHAGAARALYNWAIAEKQAVHRSYSAAVAWLTYTDFAALPPEQALAAAKKQVTASGEFRVPTKMALATRLTRERGDELTGEEGIFPWWRGINRYAFTSGLDNADAAWANWIASYTGHRAGRRIGYPRFKKKGRCRDSFALFHDVKKPGIRVEDPRHLRLPTIGVIHLTSNLRRLWRRVRKGSALIKSVRISRDADRWVACVLVVEQVPDPVTSRAQQAHGTVGVDLGVSHLATLSTGEHIPNPRGGKTAADRLTRAQRRLSRTQRGSHNRVKAARRVARIQSRTAERRQQTLHRLTKRLATQFSSVAIEDLNVAGMTRSAKGTITNPGKNVRQKAGLNREILDVAFGEFRRQLTYKTSWHGSTLTVIDRFAPSSKTCHQCGTINTTLTLADRTFTCPHCRWVCDRDENAARNIAAIAQLAHAGKPNPPSQNTGTSTMPDTPGKGATRGIVSGRLPSPTSPTGTLDNDSGRPRSTRAAGPPQPGNRLVIPTPQRVNTQRGRTRQHP